MVRPKAVVVALRNVIDFEEGSRGHRFMRARLRLGGEAGRSTSLFLLGEMRSSFLHRRAMLVRKSGECVQMVPVWVK
jgi:hypothetical protein